MNFRELMAEKHSRMEYDVLEDLNRAGLFPETTKKFCVLSTEPDFFFSDNGLAVYLDGEAVHRKRQDKDEVLRELLLKRHYPVVKRVLTICYKSRTKKRRKEIVEEIAEAMR